MQGGVGNPSGAHTSGRHLSVSVPKSSRYVPTYLYFELPEYYRVPLPLQCGTLLRVVMILKFGFNLIVLVSKLGSNQLALRLSLPCPKNTA